MSDVDDDLLLLAGGASSDEEEGEAQASRSPSPDRKGSRGKKSSRGVTRRRNDSEEEGEASSSPSSPASQRSAPMDESDSESDAGPSFEDEAVKYPLEGKFVNQVDKAEIMAMPEIKREELLAERAQEIERERQNRALRQLLKTREAESKQQDKKRKAAAADLEDNSRKTSRQRTKIGGGKVGEATTGIDSLKRARAEKNDRQRRREEDRERYKGRQHDEYSDHEQDKDSEVEWDEPKPRRKSPSPDYRDAQPAELQDIERLRMGRSRFAQVCFYPGFEDAITGCFARIVVGLDQASNQNIYRVGLIKGFVEDKPYAITNEQGKQFVTSQYVRATHGKSERKWPFITCSDSKITESEWNRYKNTCQAEGVPLPMKPKCIQKVSDINALINRSWTEAELQEKLAKSGALKGKHQSIEKQRLLDLIADAKSKGDLEKEEGYQQELSRLDGPKLAFNTSVNSINNKRASESPSMSQQDRIALLNKQNRKKNIEEVRQAQIAERRKAKAIQAAIARGETVAEDHSRRVKTVAKTNHSVSDGLDVKSTDSGVATPMTPGGTSQSAKKATNELVAKLQAAKNQQKSNGGFRGISKPLVDDDIIGALDLGLDIDIEI